jgi:eukaryotic-like serine/threonine-protein kinase
MTLSAGTRLGPYEILAPLGAGGMGEVWRARDTRLSRQVAIKVLPAEVSGDVSRLKRFEKEARAASALNHPNIVTIYDFGSSDSVSYIAMERVEGKTLRELLFTGPMPVKRLLPVATQVAEGLARAHEAGIVHRDLKPENVMVTKDGLVKILDFGLAKQTAVGSGSDEGSRIATETGTSPGVVLGTVGYMSPEQAAGQPIDFRSDQFAFGSILYEMATGKRAFQKKTAVDTLSAILNGEPEPVVEINPETPAPLRWIVERCLAKDPEGRYTSTKDLARELATIRDHLSEATSGGIGAAVPRPRVLLWRVLGAATLVAAALMAGHTLWKIPIPATPTYHPLTFRRGSIWSAKFSPDGHTIVYSASWNGEPKQLYSTRPESRESLPLPFAGADVAAISPSGEMALIKDGVLSRAPLEGGAARQVLEDVSEADWSPDGSNLAVVHNVAAAAATLPAHVSGRPRIEYPIGKVLYEAQPGGGIHLLHVSPRGDRIAFLDSPPSVSWGGSLAVVDLQGRKTTLSKGWGTVGSVNWSPKGDEVWFMGKLRQDARRGEIRAVSLAGRERVVLRVPGDFAFHDVARDGRGLAYTAFCREGIAGVVPGESAERDLSWFDYSSVQDLSADGRTMLFIEEAEEGGAPEGNAVYIRKLDGSPAVRIGEGMASGLSPDGRWVIARVLTSPSLTLIPTGAGEIRTLERGPIEQFVRGAGWFPDGKRIWFNGREPGRGIRAYVQNIDGGAPRPLLPEGFQGRLVSSDGKLIAAMDRSGPDRRVVFFSAEGQPVALSHDLPPGSEPSVFSSDSRFLFAFGLGQIPTPVYRLDLTTGKKQLWKELAPADRSGLESMGIVRLSADGRSYAYSYSRCQNDLYLVTGLR